MLEYFPIGKEKAALLAPEKEADCARSAHRFDWAVGFVPAGRRRICPSVNTLVKSEQFQGLE